MMAKGCPCRGKRGYTWHYENNVPQCAHSTEARRAYRANVRLGWVPGSAIDVPEFEEL